MIDARVIEKLATAAQTTTLNIAREYVQHLFLSSWYQQPDAGRVLFKGGTALHIIYGSPRFSEDLDFSGFGIRQAAIESLLEDALSTVERVGVTLELEEAKATSGGYLSIIRSRALGFDVAIQLEISLRKAATVKPAFALIASDLLPAYTLLHLPQDGLVEEKLRALVERGKARDFYDLYYMLRKGLIVPSARRILREVPPKLGRLKLESFDELRLFLPKHQHVLIKDFRATLARALQQYLGSR